MIRKMVLLISVLILGNTLLFGEESKVYEVDSNINPKEEMRVLISNIREEAGEKRIIIGNGGPGIYYDENIVNEKFLSTVDGVLVESVVYGFESYNKRTPKEEQKIFLNLLLPLKQKGKEIILLEYVNSKKGKKEVEKVLEENSFKGESPASRELNTIYAPMKKESGKEIVGLRDSNNILIFLNYEKYKTKEGIIKALSNAKFDFLIIDPFFKGKMFTKEEVERIKTRTNGTKRKVIAYFSIGEAEDYRAYWEPKWKVGDPSWIVEENKNWKGNYIVKFWNPQWKEIIKNVQKEMNDSNFDGYFLDTIDSYERFENK